MSKTFKFTGLSRMNGDFKVRYANDSSRVKVLAKNGHTDIFFIEMDEPEHKEDCVDALLDLLEHEGHGLCDAAVQAILDEAESLGFQVELA